MEFLKGTKKILWFLNVYTRSSVDLGFAKITSRFIEYFVFISMTLTTIPIGAFCYVNRKDFKVASAGVLYFIANSSIKIIYLALLLKRNHVIAAIDHLEELIQNRIHLNPKMANFYTSREQANSKLAKNLLRSGIYTILFFFLPNAVPPFTHLVFGWPKDNAWNFPFSVVLPFNTETYFGFYSELFVQMFTVHFYMLIFSSMISIFYAFHQFIDGLVVDYFMTTEDFNARLDDEIQQNSSRKKGIRFETRKFLKDSVDLHFGVLRAMDNLQCITSGALFFELFTFVAFLAINVFVFDRTFREEGLNFEIFLSLNNQLIQTIFCYVLCNFATKITHIVSEVSTITYGAMWYNYSVTEQQFLVVILQRSHQPFQFSGFGIINCTMATFLSLCRTALSYYLILRKSN